MRIDFVTLFPEMFTGVLSQSILKNAADRGIASYHLTDFRRFTENKHRRVDDYPYGGGAGMVLMPQPLFAAVEHILGEAQGRPRVILMTPQGDRFTQERAEQLAKEEHLIFVCGHYEGYDERVREHLATDELSIGDYVLTGGELPAMVVADSVVRLLPGALGNESSPESDSFSTGLLEYPQYTRPADFRGWKVPDVLLSGNHGLIEEWREKQALLRTFERRPDLLEDYELNDRQKAWLEALKKQRNQ
ncbi:tRNA (guanosine(37)-N1)-methyltransferase TrmD [Camelliibacillus cellulosilyticus]|uniref:tRNA (guanine-N(1)-)-methyltransferase n=1 Tax=Camelliibacillus cellulosilyticus TaxID=2174486 RepID=A0ABV9GJQ1_9BACL